MESATTAGGSISGLPPEPGSFVGRRRELAEARRQMYFGRLVTLTGPGGVGKSRLALRLARKVRRAFPDGVRRVDLAALQDPELVPQTVAAVFGLRPKAGDPTADLLEGLKDARLLLILDDCDHVLQATARFVRNVLAVPSEVRLLVTSREPLGVAGERVLPVAPLSVPQGGSTPASVHGDVFADAIRLFVDRAAAVQPGFALDEHNRDTVVRICRRLDGMPLAIELAAAQLADCSPREVLRRLDDRFSLLTSGDDPSRNDALAESIGWSFGLCTADEQLLWARLAVFIGGFDSAAAQEVCAFGRLSAHRVAELLDVLVTKSIVLREEHEGRAYYRMFDNIREYGLSQLRMAGEEDSLRGRHRDCFHRLAERYSAEQFGPQQLEWIQHMIRIHPNIRQVLAADLREPEWAEMAVWTSVLLWPYWFSGNALREGYGWLRRSLELLTERTGPRAVGLSTAAFVGLHLGELDVARSSLATADEIADELGRTALRTRMGMVHGMVAMSEGRMREAADLLEQAAAAEKVDGDAFGYVNAMILLSSVAFVSGDPRGATAAVECLRLCESSGATWTKCYALWVVALHRWLAGDHREAALLVQQAVRLNRSARDLNGLALYLDVLSWCTTTADQPHRNAHLIGAADALRRISGGRMGESTYFDDYNAAALAWGRQVLGEREFQAAYQRGAEWSREELFAYVLEEGIGRPEPARPEPGRSAPGGLSPHELRAAVLFGEGVTGADLAARLGMERRSAEQLLEGVLARLGFRDREQIEDWLRGRQQ